MASSKPRVLETFQSLCSLSSLSAEHQHALLTVPFELASSFVRHAYRELKNDPRAPQLLADICARSIASEYSVEEWVRQIVRAFDWLERNQKRAALGDIVEYVSCAFEGSDLQPGHNLDWYLETFGFSRCSPIMDASL